MICAVQFEAQERCDVQGTSPPIKRCLAFGFEKIWQLLAMHKARVGCTKVSIVEPKNPKMPNSGSFPDHYH